MQSNQIKTIWTTNLFGSWRNVLGEQSRIYCGVCGNVVGELETTIQMPFSIEDFLNALKPGHSLLSNRMLTVHSECKFAVSRFLGGIMFLPLDIYFKHYEKWKTEST